MSDARKAAQILIDEIGASGPEDVEVTAERAVEVIRRLKVRERELLAKNTETLELLRGAKAKAQALEVTTGVSRRADILELFGVIGQSSDINTLPCVPKEKSAKLGAAMVVEECLELAHALCGSWKAQNAIAQALDTLKAVILEGEFDPALVDLVEVIDGGFDAQVVVEGALIRCGINSEGGWAVGHPTNMAKGGGPIDPVSGKRLKPPGWVPPDFAAEIERQRRQKE